MFGAVYSIEVESQHAKQTSQGQLCFFSSPRSDSPLTPHHLGRCAKQAINWQYALLYGYKCTPFLLLKNGCIQWIIFWYAFTTHHALSSKRNHHKFSTKIMARAPARNGTAWQRFWQCKVSTSHCMRGLCRAGSFCESGPIRDYIYEGCMHV